ncbi:ribokinase [Caldisalinibacter kiritimatiensis]|uniref:Ribokinase n=1 Tax=Caldisalinibacter kiritimatiensis TaxID=1304284 RepID=R1CT03_9FIRM|nr:ribokinase [Caldisalinibacter kiritimatiensis]EOD01781.1 Ribokinase [Caldisalinibacter kiritimatiensis]
MSDITVIGSLNMDLVATVKNMPKVGETLIGKELKQIPGGKGANQAVAAARLGAKVSMIGKVGDDGFGKNLMDSMNSDGIDTKYIKREENTSTGVALITVNDEGDNSIVVIPGANFKVTKEDIDKATEAIEGSKIVLLQLEIPIDVVKYSLKKAKTLGKYTILNPAPAQNLDDEIIENVDLLIPNETELEILSGIEIKQEEDILNASRKLIKKGVKELIVTMGGKGCLYINKDIVKKYKAHKVQVVDTTAAGDSFTAAVSVQLSKKESIDKAIEFAMKVGALTVTKEGAQSSLPYLKDVLDFKGE